MSLLTRWEPKTLSNWFEDFFNEDWRFEPRALTTTYPAVEVKEEKEHYLMSAELPGLSKEEINVEVKNGVLTISGEKKHEKKEEKKGYFYSERGYGRFERSFNLGENVSEGNVEAAYRNGVLEIRLKKIKEKEPKQITVK